MSEGLANLRDGASLGAALVGVVATVVAGAIWADTHAATAIVDAETAYLDGGGDLLVAYRPRGGTIDAAACAALGSTRGVRSTAAMNVIPSAARLVGRPESSQTVVTSTEGILEMLGVDDLAPQGIIASTTIADRWQWQPGAHIQLAESDASAIGAPSDVLTVGAVRDLGRLEEGASTGVLFLRSPTGEADTCYVRIEPQYRDDLREALPAPLGDSLASPVQVVDRVPPGAFAQDPVGAFDGRITRWAGAAAGAVLGLLWAIVAWTRRGRAALYASIGVPYPGGVLIRWTEGLGVAAIGSTWGIALGVSVAVVVDGSDPGLALDLGLRGGALSLSVLTAIVVLVGLWRPPTFSALKDH